MSYCRFENTVGDMRDCVENMELDDAAPESEKRAHREFIELCLEVAENYGEVE